MLTVHVRYIRVCSKPQSPVTILLCPYKNCKAVDLEFWCTQDRVRNHMMYELTRLAN